MDRLCRNPRFLRIVIEDMGQPWEQVTGSRIWVAGWLAKGLNDVSDRSE